MTTLEFLGSSPEACRDAMERWHEGWLEDYPDIRSSNGPWPRGYYWVQSSFRREKSWSRYPANLMDRLHHQNKANARQEGNRERGLNDDFLLNHRYRLQSLEKRNFCRNLIPCVIYHTLRFEMGDVASKSI